MSKQKERTQANLRFQKNHFPFVLLFLLLDAWSVFFVSLVTPVLCCLNRSSGSVKCLPPNSFPLTPIFFLPLYSTGLKIGQLIIEQRPSFTGKSITVGSSLETAISAQRREVLGRDLCHFSASSSTLSSRGLTLMPFPLATVNREMECV